MISKFANHAEFGDEIFTEMDKYMSEGEGIVRTASQADVEPAGSAFASLVETLVKCAGKLDDAGHPAAEKADKILMFIQKEMI